MTKTVAVIGATGDVGQGIVAELLAIGHRVVAVSRSVDRLSRLADRYGTVGELTTLAGSVESIELGDKLAAALSSGGRPDAIVTSINGAQAISPVFDLEATLLERILRDNLSTHLVAARSLVPIVADDGMYLGVGGGMADLVFPGYAAISMAQAAQRMLFRYLAKEYEARPLKIRELLLHSMIDGESKRGQAEPHWITAEEVGRHVVAILSDAASYEGPILSLKSKKQVGSPERRFA